MLYIYCSRASCLSCPSNAPTPEAGRKTPSPDGGGDLVPRCIVLCTCCLPSWVLCPSVPCLREPRCRCHQIFPEREPLRIFKDKERQGRGGRGPASVSVSLLQRLFGRSFPTRVTFQMAARRHHKLPSYQKKPFLSRFSTTMKASRPRPRRTFREKIGYSLCGCIMYLYYCIPYQYQPAQGYAASTENSTPCALNTSLTSRK